MNILNVFTKKEAHAVEAHRLGDEDMLKAVPQNADDAQLSTSFVREGFVKFTAVQANTVLKECHFDGQRKIVDSHVDVLADIMKRDQWEPKDKLDFADIDGRLILINGYHRMTAQVKSGREILWSVVVHACKTMDEVKRLYYKFDTNVRARSGNVIVGAVGIAEKYGISQSVASGLFRAIPIIANEFSFRRSDRDILTAKVMDRRFAVADEYAKAAKSYEKCISNLSGGARFKSKLLSAGVMSVALVTLRYQPILAVEFWTGTAENDGLRKGDPRLTLFNDLNSRTMSAGSQTQSVVAPVKAWNAYYENRPLKLIRVESRPVIYIAGTPFDR